MKKIKFKKPDLRKLKPEKGEFKGSFKTRTFRVGGYSVAATAIVVAIAVALNLFVSALPSSATQFDVTSNGLYTLSEETEKVLDKIDDKIDIYWIAQEGQEDSTLEGLLEKYKGINSNINIIMKDPDVYPGFAKEYTDSTVNNNSLVVVNGDKYSYVDYYDIYEYDSSDYYSYNVSFAGESALTSALDYVTRDNLPEVYELTGHGEADLSSDFESALAKENLDVQELSLVSAGGVPENADMLFINAPETDISSEEMTMISEYLEKGGNMMLITAPQKSITLTNLESVMQSYGVTASEGIVIEGSQNNYAWNSPHYLLPEIQSHEITEPLIENGYYVLLPASQGILVNDELDENITVSELLTTSDSSYSKLASYSMETFEKEDGDIDGPFALAVAITDTIDENTESNIVWISSSYMLDDQVNAQVSGGNQDFFLNAVSWMCGETDSITIHTKSLDNDYLTMGSASASILTMLIVGLIPVAVLIIGICIWVRRKRR